MEMRKVRELNNELERLRDEGRKLVPLFEDEDGDKIAMKSPPMPGNTTRSRDGAKYGRVEGLGASFLKEIRQQGADLKALDATSGGATMPGSFFDRRLREMPQRRLSRTPS